MRWPWGRRPRRTAGEQAKRATEQHLVAAKARWPEVHRVARSLRELRETNHFAEQLQAIFEGERRHHER